MSDTWMALREQIEKRLFKRAAEIEALAVKFPSWEISEAKQHAQDLRDYARLLDRLTSDNKRMGTALKPFSKAFLTLSSRWQDHETHWQDALPHPISVAHLRQARAALTSKEGEDE